MKLKCNPLNTTYNVILWDIFYCVFWAFLFKCNTFVLLDVTVAAFRGFHCTVTEENRGVWLKKGVTQR